MLTTEDKISDRSLYIRTGIVQTLTSLCSLHKIFTCDHGCEYAPSLVQKCGWQSKYSPRLERHHIQKVKKQTKEMPSTKT